MGEDCVSVSMPKVTHAEACFKKNDDCGWKLTAGYSSLVKTKQGPPQPPPKGTKITADFKLIGWSGTTAKVRDLWAQKNIGTATNSISAMVEPHGLALLRLSK
jgi:hypothetical protein